MSDIPAERRGHQRVEVVLKLEYLEPRELLQDYITDLGEGGMFVRTSHRLDVGQRVQFRLSFPGLLQPLELRGVVRWRREPGDGSGLPEGLGVEFLLSSEGDRQKVRGLMGPLLAESPTCRGSLTVLLVEDNDFAREMYAFAVRDLERRVPAGSPLQVLTAADATQALRLLEESVVDLLIVDHFLPGMTGAELVRQLRASKRWRTLAILVVSAGGESVKREAMESGADLYLDKPVLRRQLVDTLAKLLCREPPASPSAAKGAL